MRSQNSVIGHTTKSLGSLTLITNHTSSQEQLQYCSTTPIGQRSNSIASVQQNVQMTTGGGGGGGGGGGVSGGVSGKNNNTTSVTSHQKTGTTTLSSCNTIASTSSLNTLNKTMPSIVRHSNGNITNNNNNNTTSSRNKTISTNNNNNNEGNNNPNWSKLQTLEQRKLELEKLLNEKNWLLQQIHKQEAQILNGNYENFNLLDLGITGSGTTNSILRRKGSSSLKLNKSNVHFNGKNNRLTLSKSEYDLAQENKLNNQSTGTTNQTVMGMKKRQGPPQKTNSFHDSTSASALSLTKSPSFEYNGNSLQGSSNNHNIKYSVNRPHHGSSENLTNSLAVTQCDKYYLSPTNQMYSDGSGFIKASQNIKQCLSPSPLHKIIALNDTEVHRVKQQQHHSSNGHNLVHHNGSQSHLEQYETLDALSLSPSTTCGFEQGQLVANQHSNLWRTISNSDRTAWCDSTSYVELDSDGGNPYHNMKPLPKKLLPASISGLSLQQQQSPDSSSIGHFYTIGSGHVVNSYPNTIDKACDEVSISSVNSETNKKPKNKQWMESSLDGPIIRPNILQTSSNVADTMALYPALSPTLSQNPQYPYYNISRQVSTSAAAASGKLTPSPAPTVGGSSLLVSVVNSRPPTRTLTHHAHPHHKQGYRERTKLSSQSMSSGSYRPPKTKLDDDNSHLSHSTSYLNVDPYHHHHFHLQPPPLQQQQQQQQQPSYHHSHYHMEIPTGSNFAITQLQQHQQQQLQQQKANKQVTPVSSSQQHIAVAKFSPTIQHQPAPSISGDDFDGTIRYAASSASQPSKLANSSQPLIKGNHSPVQKPGNPPTSLFVNAGQQQLSPQSNTVAATSPDIRIESPKNMTVVQQATFLPYKEVTKPFEMSDFYKYSTKFRQKEANIATISKSST